MYGFKGSPWSWVLLLMFAAGCSNGQSGAVADGDGAAANSAALQASDWTLQSLVIDGQALPLPPGSAATLRAVEGEGVSGMAFVNRYSGRLAVTDAGGLSWGQAFALTKMAGPPELMELESQYLQALQQTTRARIDGSGLTLQSGDGKTKLVFSGDSEQ